MIMNINIHTYNYIYTLFVYVCICIYIYIYIHIIPPLSLVDLRAEGLRLAKRSLLVYLFYIDWQKILA